jgi:hypothetical protein
MYTVTPATTAPAIVNFLPVVMPLVFLGWITVAIASPAVKAEMPEVVGERGT